jgi:hypothetical protein
MLILLLRADMASPIPSGGLEGFPKVALGNLREARSHASSTTPVSLYVPLVIRTAEEHAFLGEATASHETLDEADRLFTTLEQRNYYLRNAWSSSSGIMSAFRGHCLSLLRDAREAVRVIAPTIATARFAGTRAARLADLAAAHAQLGEVDRACELLEQSLDVATGIGETEKARRVAGVRRRHLEAWQAEPAVRRVDERLATIL